MSTRGTTNLAATRREILPHEIPELEEAPGRERPGRSGSPGLLSVIMPVYNEAPHLEAILERVLAQACVRELVVVDDASTDGTRAQLALWREQHPCIRVVRHEVNRGKGAAIRSGLRFVTSAVVIIQDADLEYDPADYDAMLSVLLKGQADVVYGSRFLHRENVTWKWHRAANWILTAIGNSCTGLHLTDAHTCLKMLPRALLETLALEEERFGFCAEVTAKLARIPGIRIAEVPVSYHPRRRGEGKKIGLRDGVRAVYCYLRYGPMARLTGRCQWSPVTADALTDLRGVSRSANHPAPSIAEGKHP